MGKIGETETSPDLESKLLSLFWSTQSGMNSKIGHGGGGQRSADAFYPYFEALKEAWIPSLDMEVKDSVDAFYLYFEALLKL